VSNPEKHIVEETLAEIGRTFMPFGRFGPEKYPPRGLPIYDLPAEYLAWFATKGFPKGRLGDLLNTVYQAKAEGIDSIFDALRQKAGGRASLRKRRKHEWKFQ
jgi:uncharacterized protein (DUF3820 family)